MVSAFEITLIANNWTTFIFGTIGNLLVLYLCFEVKDVEIVKNRWYIVMQTALQLLECFGFTIIHLVRCFVQSSTARTLLLQTQLFHYVHPSGDKPLTQPSHISESECEFVASTAYIIHAVSDRRGI